MFFLSCASNELYIFFKDELFPNFSKLCSLLASCFCLVNFCLILAKSFRFAWVGSFSHFLKNLSRFSLSFIILLVLHEDAGLVSHAFCDAKWLAKSVIVSILSVTTLSTSALISIFFKHWYSKKIRCLLAFYVFQTSKHRWLHSMYFLSAWTGLIDASNV